MLALESDKTYKLTPVAATHLGDDGKLYIHVKFTDSSFRAIEEYATRVYNQKKSLGPNTNLSIELSSTADQGHFDVPIGGGDASNNKGGNIRRFQFSLSAIPQEGNASSFECFQQKKSSDSLAAFGSFARRLQVKAQEDVFDATRERMAAVDEESKKNRAREISTASSNALKSGASRRATSLGGGNTVRHAVSTASSATNAALLHDAASLAKRKAAERMSQQPTTGTGNNGKASSASSTPSTSPQHCLRDRILYSLAVKPQTEAQLIASLKLSNREAIDLAPIVKQLCYPVSLSGVYSLRREAFGDVKPDHPLLSSHEEKMAVRKHAAAAQSSSSSNLSVINSLVANSTSTSSSSTTTTAATSAASTQKPVRPPPAVADAASAAKVRRLESPANQSSSSSNTSNQHHNNNHHNEQQPSSLLAIAGKTRPGINAGAHHINNSSNNNNNGNNTNSGSNNNRLNGRNKNSPRDNGLLLDVDFGMANSSQASRGNDSRNLNDFGSSSSPQIPVISNREQRSAMKAEFMASYSEYRRLHDSLSEKTAFFREMRPQLEACEPGTDQYRALEDSIRDAYAQLQNDESYMAAKRKLDELHETLARTKQAIEDYDNVTHSSSSTTSAAAAPSSSATALTSGSAI